MGTQVCDDGRVVPDPPPEWGAQRALTTPGPGWCALIHFDLWHQGMGNTTPDYCRFMLKFQFYRTAVPRAPSWRHTAAVWRPHEAHGQRPPLLPVWLAVWRWMLGADAVEGADAPVVDWTAGATTRAQVDTLHATHSRVPCLANHECVGLERRAAQSMLQPPAAKMARVDSGPPGHNEVAGVLAAFRLAESDAGRQILINVVSKGGVGSAGCAAARRATDALALLPPRSVTQAAVAQMSAVLRKGATSRSRLHAAYILGEWATAPVGEVREALLGGLPTLVDALRPTGEPDGRVREAVVGAIGIHGTLPGSDGPALLAAVVDMLEAEPLLPAQPAIALALLHIQSECPLPEGIFPRCIALLGSRKDRYAGSLVLELLQR